MTTKIQYLSAPANIIRYAWFRVQTDCLGRVRLSEYQDLLQAARNAQYEIHSVISFWRLLQTGVLSAHTRYLVLRHDVDAKSEGTTRMRDLEVKFGVNSSYYFRLSTVNIRLMNEIHLSGGEVGYHYEELATIVKRQGLAREDQVMAVLDEVRSLFKTNLACLRVRTGLPMASAASHGDFANKMVGVTNKLILADPAFRKEVGIEVEAYDKSLMAPVNVRCSDNAYPSFWWPEHPTRAVCRGVPVIYVLTHPQVWDVNPMQNIAADLLRLREGFRYWKVRRQRLLAQRS